MDAKDDISKAVTETVGQLSGRIYDDMISPSGKLAGTALATLLKVGLSPIAMLDWGYEESKRWLAERIQAKLAATPPEFRRSPTALVLTTATAHIAMSFDTPELRNLYGELLSKALDSRTQSMVHPSFFPVVSQLTPEEALALIGFLDRSGTVVFEEMFRPEAYGSVPTIEEQFRDYCESIGLQAATGAELWLDNLQRLGLVAVEKHTEANLVPEDEDSNDPHIDNVSYRYLILTEFGAALLHACAPVHVPNVTS